MYYDIARASTDAKNKYRSQNGIICRSRNIVTAERKCQKVNAVRFNLTIFQLGGSPGLVVMGDDSCSRGCGFESQCHILDGHDIFHIDLL